MYLQDEPFFPRSDDEHLIWSRYDRDFVLSHFYTEGVFKFREKDQYKGGDLFGEISLLDKAPKRKFTVFCPMEVEVAYLEKSTLEYIDQLLKDYLYEKELFYFKSTLFLNTIKFRSVKKHAKKFQKRSYICRE